MIVNTAYIHMGSVGPAVNPNLWQDGASNYPVVLTTRSEISSNGLYLHTEYGSATFSELLLTGFNSLTISATGRILTSQRVNIEFFNSAGQVLGTETVTFTNSVNTNTVNIPSSAKIQGAKIKIENGARNVSITLSSALLS